MRLSKNTVEGFSQYSIPLLVSQKRVPQAFDPAPAIDPARLAAQDEAIAAIEAKLAAFEGKMLEQERTIRHTLTMLIEWIESDDAQRAAA